MEYNTYDGAFEWGINNQGERISLHQTEGLLDNWERVLEGRREGIHSVIDIGCGDGSLARGLFTRGVGKSFTLVDISQKAVDYVRTHPFPGLADARCASALQLPFEDRSFDPAVLCHVLEHFSAPLDALVEATRVARLVLAEVPLDDALLSNVRQWFRTRVTGLPRTIGGVGHLHFFSRRTLHRTIEHCDLLRVISTRQMLPPAHKESLTKRLLAK